MSKTTLCRLFLLASPILVPLEICAGLVASLWAGVQAATESLIWEMGDSWRFWYRRIYRPARYGHVADSESQ